MMRALTLLVVGLTAAGARGDGPGRSAETLFELKVRPVLAGTCFRCHGGTKTRGKLRVDSREALLKGGESGPALVPGDPDKSLLVRALRHTHDTLRMPPGKPLPRETVDAFAAWIKQGAVWPRATGASPFAARRHWAFQPVKPVAPPPDPTTWATHPIDRFIMARLRQQGLRPVGPAPKRTLLRRVYFDLVGLPPSPAEMERFLADDAPDAFEWVVERLLASPQYGERWGRHWLDVAHYADTAGDNADYPIPEIRLYRDYVLDAFNADLPYDQFVREQLAGDILAKTGPREDYARRVVATGFLALTRRYATAPYELWHLSLEDAIATTGSAFLGLTLRCARCHDHKFDPVTTRDYYALYGVFASTTFPYTGSEEFASMRKPRAHFVPLVPGPKPTANAPAAYAVSEGKPVSVPVQRGGNPDAPGPVVPRGVPKFLEGARPVRIPAGSSGRLELARWLTRPDHPLTARVMVNRIWQHHFGAGLVRTPSNFGTSGETPTHPELLDYLADRFVRGGWSIKALHRLILSSKTYQLASTHDATAAARDPGNRWHWHHDRRRLDAEALRDALLYVGGNLDLRRPGPHPFPPQNAWRWTQHNPFKAVYPSRHRSVYLMTQRIQRHPFLALFDGPDTNYSTATRSTSTVPLQALYLMNNPFVRAQAEGFARNLLAASADPARRVEEACRRTWGRPPTPAEVAHAIAYVHHYRAELTKAGAPAGRVELEAWTSYARVVLTANEFMYVD